MSMLFDPAKLPPRDEYGYTWHPDFDERFEHPELGEEYIHTEVFSTLGLEIRYVLFESDDVSEEVRNKYYDDGSAVPEWQPTPPEGDGWRIVAIYDTEDGPAALFVREVVEVAQV